MNDEKKQENVNFVEVSDAINALMRLEIENTPDRSNPKSGTVMKALDQYAAIVEKLESEIKGLSKAVDMLIVGNYEFDWTKYPASFALKFCDPLLEVSEDELIPREWSISKEELEDGKR